MANQLLAALTILRRKQVQAETGYSRSTIYLRISQGLFVKPVSLGARAVGFPAGEVASLNAARIAGKTEAEIRTLVTRVRQLRTQLYDFIDVGFETCPYNRLSCCD